MDNTNRTRQPQTKPFVNRANVTPGGPVTRLTTWTYTMTLSCGHVQTREQVSKQPRPRIGMRCPCITCRREELIKAVDRGVKWTRPT